MELKHLRNKEEIQDTREQYSNYGKIKKLKRGCNEIISFHHSPLNYHFGGE